MTDAPLVLLKHHRLARPLARRMGFLSLPTWVQSVLDTRRPLEEIIRGERSGRKSRKNDVRKIMHDGLEARLTRDPEEVRVLLHDWQDALRGRFGTEYSGHSADWMRQAQRFCEVLWVERAGERLGGVLLEPRGDVLRMGVFGLRDAAQAREGLLTASYYFSIDQAVTRGFRELDLGGTRPVLSDGVLTHKRKWGACLRPVRQWEYVALRADVTHPAVRALVSAHPLIAEAEGRLYAVIDPDALRAPVAPSVTSMLAHGGLSGALQLTPAGGAPVQISSCDAPSVHVADAPQLRP